MILNISITTDKGYTITKSIEYVSLRRIPDVASLLIESSLNELLPILEGEDNINKENDPIEYINEFINSLISIACDHPNWYTFNQTVKDNIREWYIANGSCLLLDKKIPLEIIDIIKEVARQELINSKELALVLNETKKV